MERLRLKELLAEKLPRFVHPYPSGDYTVGVGPRRMNENDVLCRDVRDLLQREPLSEATARIFEVILQRGAEQAPTLRGDIVAGG